MRPLVRPTYPKLALVLALWAALLAGPAVRPLSAQTKLSDVLQASGYSFVPLKRPTRNSIAAEVEINGKRALLVVDSGAPVSSLQRPWVRRLKLEVAALPGSMSGAHGSEETNLGKIHVGSFKVGGVELGGSDLQVSDLTGLKNIQGPTYIPTGSFIPAQPEMVNRMEVDGFFGANTLNACHAIVDLKNFRLYVKPPGAGGGGASIVGGLRNAGLVEIPFDNANHRYILNAQINGNACPLLLDTGASLTYLDRQQVGRFKLSGDESSSVRTRDVGGKLGGETRYLRLASFRLGNWELRDKGFGLQSFHWGRTGVGNLVGLLGIDVMATYGAIVDCGNSRLYLERPR